MDQKSLSVQNAVLKLGEGFSKLGNKEKLDLENVIKDLKFGSPEDILDKLLKDPSLIDQRPELIQRILREEATNVFDLSSTEQLNRSTAAMGWIGRLNKLGQRKKNRRYYRKVYDLHRANVNNYTIVAEGDSWFEYPLFVKDTLDWLDSFEENAVYSSAYGADWLSNMIKERQYIEALTIHDPDYFLLSGGGNDLVGGQRLATLINIPSTKIESKSVSEIFTKYENDPNLVLESSSGSPLRSEIYKLAKPLVRQRELNMLLSILVVEYFGLLHSIDKAKKNGKFPRLISISHGYDFPIPTNRILSGPSFWKIGSLIAQGVTNLVMPNGVWLFRPLMTKGIHDSVVQRAILFYLIDRYNEVMSNLACHFKFHRFVDCRGLFPRSSDWYNELHPHSNGFRKVARAFHHCIHDFDSDNVEDVIVARKLN